MEGAGIEPTTCLDQKNAYNKQKEKKYTTILFFKPSLKLFNKANRTVERGSTE